MKFLKFHWEEMSQRNQKYALVDVHKKSLEKLGDQNFKDWLNKEENVYIGRRNMYVEGTFQSKWHNPYTVKKYGLEKCLEMYEEHVRTSNLWDDLEELSEKTLGCWCVNFRLQDENLKEEKCHGQVLLRLLKEFREKQEI